ncbi:MAG: glycerol kinase, partial [Methanomicrobia archaeon]|nr:glycerol kinase [Methanomicrobia archaeon]
MKKYILSIDQGTTSTRAVLINQEGIACFKAQREVECLYPKPGWVEQDALGLWVSVIDVVNEVLIKSNLSMANIEAIGVTNQRETAIVWDKETGLPIYPAVVWQSRQSVEICYNLEDKK